MPEYVLDHSLARETWQSLDSFTRGYIEAAMWLLTDDDGSSLDYLGLHDVADITIRDVVEDCQQFQTEQAEWLEQAGTPEQNGHDYYLTRNHHGAGFWDRGYPENVGEALTEASHAAGDDTWYLGDDGLVYRA